MAVKLPFQVVRDFRDVQQNFERIQSLLGSPTAQAWPLLQTPGTIAGSVAAGTAYSLADGARTLSGTGGAAGTARPYLVWTPAEWPAVSAMNLQASLTTNVTQTGVTFKVGLYSVVVSGAANQIFTMTLVAGTEVTFTAPVAAAEPSGVTADFAPPAAGLYVIGLTHTGTTAATSATTYNGILRGVG